MGTKKPHLSIASDRDFNACRTYTLYAPRIRVHTHTRILYTPAHARTHTHIPSTIFVCMHANFTPAHTHTHNLQACAYTRILHTPTHTSTLQTQQLRQRAAARRTWNSFCRMVVDDTDDRLQAPGLPPLSSAYPFSALLPIPAVPELRDPPPKRRSRCRGHFRSYNFRCRLFVWKQISVCCFPGLVMNVRRSERGRNVWELQCFLFNADGGRCSLVVFTSSPAAVIQLRSSILFQSATREKKTRCTNLFLTKCKEDKVVSATRSSAQGNCSAKSLAALQWR